MDDASLEDFLGDESEDGDGARPDGTEPDEADPADTTESGDSGDASPATTTSRWTGERTECGVCGSSVERLWESADGLVCATCKEW